MRAVYERERRWEGEKARMRLEAEAGPDLTRWVKPVPKVKWYGF